MKFVYEEEWLTISEMYKFLETNSLGRNCFCLESVDSTSTYLKRMWELFSHGHTVIAKGQHLGRGRSGKSFYSPKGDGLYFSVLLTDKKYINDPLFTVKMSYAVCMAIDKVTETNDAKIKWVNDIYAGNKKICGILCEAVTQNEKTGIILGIGINLSVNKGEVPAELKGKIGSLRDLTRKKINKEQLCANVLNEIEKLYAGKITANEFISLYKQRSNLLGREIKVLKNGEEIRAAALDISKNGGLIVRYQTGITQELTSGEISILI